MEVSTLVSVSAAFGPPPAVVPVLVGPMYALFAILPAIAVALGRLAWQLLGPKGLWRTAQMLWRQKIAVGIVAGAFVGLYYAWPHLFPPAVVSAAAPAEAGEWPYFRGNLQRTGYQGGKVTDPVRGQKVWSYTYNKDITTVFSSPALVGNRLYTTMAFYGYFKDMGAICCLDPDTAGLIWAYRSDYRSTFSSPVVKGKYLVVGEGLHLTKDARVFCFDVQKSEKDHKGAKLWSYRTGSHVESSPCIFDDKVVIGAGDDGVYCFRLEPDAKGEAQIVWQLPAKNYTDIETSPVYQDGKLYWGLGRFGGQAVVCIDGNTGQEYWRVPTPAPVVGSPAIANGKLYVGMGFGDYVFDATQVAGDLPPKLKDRGWDEARIQEYLKTIKREGQVWCIDMKKDVPDPNARVLWKFTAGQVVLATPAVDGNVVYFGSRDGKMYAVSADKGEKLHEFDFHEPVLASPAVGKDTVYAATLRGRIAGLDKARFRLVWDVPLNLGNNEFCSSSPAVGRGHLYVGLPGKGLMCLGRPKSDEGAVWAGSLGGAGKGGWVDDSVIPDSGVYAWGAPMGEANAKGAAGLLPPAAYLSGAFYVSAGKGLTRLYCGKEIFAKPTRQWTVPSDNPVSLSAAGTDKGIFFVDGKIGDAGRQLRCVDPNTGAERWRRPVDKDATGEFVMAGAGRLLVAESARGVTCLDVSDPAKAQEAWKADTGPTVGAPFVEEDLVLVSVGSPARLVGLELATGKQVWDAALPRPPTTNPVMLMDRVWVGDEKGLRGYARANKGDVWSVPCGRVAGALAGRGDRLACLADDGELVLVNASIGDVTARLGKVPGGVPPILTDDTLLYLTKDAIQAYNLKTGEKAQWTKIDTDFLGKVVTPMIVANSYVVFGTDDEGLVCMKPKK